MVAPITVDDVVSVQVRHDSLNYFYLTKIKIFDIIYIENDKENLFGNE